jgi:hypothetical protein
MSIEWISTQHTEKTQYSHRAHCNSNDQSVIKKAVDQTVEKAIGYLDDNIRDDSLYFLVEWKSDDSSLTIFVSDDTKHKESLHLVRCTFDCASEEKGIDGDSIQYWTRDLLTTSADFIRFSLVAIFSKGDRQRTVLL